jgi:hypothetical protein
MIKSTLYGLATESVVKKRTDKIMLSCALEPTMETTFWRFAQQKLTR